MPYQITELRPKTCQRAADLFAAAGGADLTTEVIEQTIYRHRGLSLVAELDGEVVGVVFCRKLPDGAFVQQLVVEKKHQNKGVEKRLADGATSKLNHSNVNKYRLELLEGGDDSFWSAQVWSDQLALGEPIQHQVHISDPTDVNDPACPLYDPAAHQEIEDQTEAVTVVEAEAEPEPEAKSEVEAGPEVENEAVAHVDVTAADVSPDAVSEEAETAGSVTETVSEKAATDNADDTASNQSTDDARVDSTNEPTDEVQAEAVTEATSETAAEVTTDAASETAAEAAAPAEEDPPTEAAAPDEPPATEPASS